MNEAGSASVPEETQKASAHAHDVEDAVRVRIACHRLHVDLRALAVEVERDRLCSALVLRVLQLHADQLGHAGRDGHACVAGRVVSACLREIVQVVRMLMLRADELCHARRDGHVCTEGAAN